uniref:Uncharacterized protein n=1 Tax=Solanum tuberosum TaxID=4113 RepID=M1D3M4_SOLTU
MAEGSGGKLAEANQEVEGDFKLVALVKTKNVLKSAGLRNKNPVGESRNVLAIRLVSGVWTSMYTRSPVKLGDTRDHSASNTNVAKWTRTGRFIMAKSLGIAESTWRVAEGSYFAFCSSVLSPKGKDQVGGKREQSAHRQEVPRSSTMSPNEPEHDDVEGWCKTAMNYTKRRIAELISDFD